VSRWKERRKEAVIVGAIIRRLREDRGWTKETLAERAEMNVSYLGFVERGDNVPTLTIICNRQRRSNPMQPRSFDA
jgi:ribosome-binding protein aMBF1 (putative translation factor)